jgi:predicted nucleotidyltransferase
MMTVVDRLAEPARSAINAFVTAAQRVFGDDLASITLFGSAAEARLRLTSDINVIVVLARVEPDRLAAIGEAYRLAHAAVRLSAMFIRENEIASAQEAFAVKFTDIAARHETIYGRDPFVGLTVTRDALLWRTRQVLINLLLRLRERYALSSAYGDQLGLAAADAVGPLRAAASALLTLERGETVPPREALQQIAEAGGQAAALAAIAGVRETGSVPAAGGAAALEAAIKLATLLHERVERLLR